MKDNPKNSDSLSHDQTMNHLSSSISILPKLMVWLIIFITFTTIFYSLKFTHIINPQITHQEHPHPPRNSSKLSKPSINPEIKSNKTELQHIVFGIAASANHWDHRKNYIKQWWRPTQTRGFAWLDRPVNVDVSEINSLPPIKISSDTSNFPYTSKDPNANRSGLRMTRIVLETVRLSLKNVRWVVMGDDDTVFIPDNLVRVLRKLDHTQFYYVGSTSESHPQNLHFSYNMGYGGGGYAISYPLAQALEKMLDGCMYRYPELFGSDDRIQACLAELGVPLTKEIGFHQYDVYGNLFGLLAAHPITPLVSIHHLDVVKPIFPNMDWVQALEHLKHPIKLDSAALMQQSICYDKSRNMTVSVSWGYAVQFLRGLISPREMERPSVTFLSWYGTADYIGFPFNTRPVSRNICRRPLVYYLSNALYNHSTNQTTTKYVRHKGPHRSCTRMVGDLSQIYRVEVYKKPDPYMWDKAPRRNCCRVLPSEKNGTVAIAVGVCRDGEIINFQ